ncbi:MAG: phosphohistidine phosphatase SixA [Leptolyngbyaceae cyanobacterium MAG.088]|nr:phosphohistidine phosphatase SixA [Leptolyngbyaceae cyanobacterium MAG.088]
MSDRNDIKNDVPAGPINYRTQVYFIRHGIAAERGTYLKDEQRPLTDKGIHKTAKIAQRLSTLDLQFDLLFTSPLVRAVQTAEILCQANLATDYQIFPSLKPGGNLQDWLDWLNTWQTSTSQTVALVGHEPTLSQWSQQLVHGSTHHHWVLKKAGIIGLSIPQAKQAIGQSELFWLAPPRLIL